MQIRPLHRLADSEIVKQSYYLPMQFNTCSNIISFPLNPPAQILARSNSAVLPICSLELVSFHQHDLLVFQVLSQLC